ncbi:MAG: response regulator transcription factor [Pedobacter sp.]|nr:MAG: response regulator transcription factor [Pedobacter sp.]
MQYNCLVADDNIIEQDIVALYISKIPTLRLVASCNNGAEAAKVLEEEDVDIVFSDIDMPGLSGINLLKGLKHPPVFIFITSFTDYAVESFELDAVDYIVKPLTFERFYQAANKAIEYIEVKRVLQNNGTQILTKGEETPVPEDDYFFIKQTHNITKLKYSEVIYVESMGDFSKIFTSPKDYFITLVSLKNLEQQLPAGKFMRVHRQFIVNTDRIVTIGGTSVSLDNKQIIPVGELYKQELLSRVVDKKVIGRYTK